MGLLGMSLPILVVNFVASKLPAGVVGLQQTLVPMLTYAFALLLRIDRVNALKLTGLAVGLGAVLVVVLPRASLPSPDMTIWVLVSFLTPLCYGMAKLTNAQKADVKRVTKELLETLKAEKLVLNWRGRQQSRSVVR